MRPGEQPVQVQAHGRIPEEVLFRYEPAVAAYKYQRRYGAPVPCSSCYPQPILLTSDFVPESQKPLAIVDVSKAKAGQNGCETFPPDNSEYTLPPIQSRPADQLTAAAEVLQSFSQTEPRSSFESSHLIVDLPENDAQPPSGRGRDDRSYTSPDAFSSYQAAATPAACPSIGTPYSSISATSSSIPRSIPDGWSRANPDSRQRRFSVLSHRRPSFLADTSYNQCGVGGSHNGVPEIGFQEACLMRCFIENLAAAVSQ